MGPGGATQPREKRTGDRTGAHNPRMEGQHHRCEVMSQQAVRSAALEHDPGWLSG